MPQDPYADILATPSRSSAPKPQADPYADIVDTGPLRGWESIADAAAQKYGVDPMLVRAVVHQESGGNARAVSKAGAQGLMQLMPGTAAGLGVRDPFDPHQNVDGGVRYLRQMLDRYNGDPSLALAAYNAGPGNVKGRVPVNGETEKYVARIMANYRPQQAGILRQDARAYNVPQGKVKDVPRGTTPAAPPQITPDSLAQIALGGLNPAAAPAIPAPLAPNHPVRLAEAAKTLPLDLASFVANVKSGSKTPVPINQAYGGPLGAGNQEFVEPRRAAAMVAFGLGLTSSPEPTNGFIGKGKEKWSNPHDAAVVENLLNPKSATFRRVMAAVRAGGGKGADPTPYDAARMAGAGPTTAAIVNRDPGIGDATTAGLVGRAVGAAMAPVSTLRVLAGDARPDSELSREEGAAYGLADLLAFGGTGGVGEKAAAGIVERTAAKALARSAEKGVLDAAGRKAVEGALRREIGKNVTETGLKALGNRTLGKVGTLAGENIALQLVPIIGQASDLTVQNGKSFLENAKEVGGESVAGFAKLFDPRTLTDPNATAYEKAQAALSLGLLAFGAGVKGFDAYRGRAIKAGIDPAVVDSIIQAGRMQRDVREAPLRPSEPPVGTTLEPVRPTPSPVGSRLSAFDLNRTTEPGMPEIAGPRLADLSRRAPSVVSPEPAPAVEPQATAEPRSIPSERHYDRYEGLSIDAIEKAKKARNAGKHPGFFTVGDLIGHDPVLRRELEPVQNVSVSFSSPDEMVSKFGGETRGQYYGGVEMGNKIAHIELNSDLLDDPMTLRQVLMHEVAHAKRDKLGRAMGAEAGTHEEYQRIPYEESARRYAQRFGRATPYDEAFPDATPDERNPAARRLAEAKVEASQTASVEPTAPKPAEIPEPTHHSQSQPRDEGGRFDGPPEEVTGLSVAQRTKEAETTGTAKPEPVRQLSNQEAHAKGKAAVESGDVDPEALVRDLAERNRAATPEEYGSILEGRRRLLKEINRTAKEVDAAVGTSDHAAKLQAYEAAKARAAEFDSHLDRVKGASGGSLQALKIGTTIDEGDFAQVSQEARRKKGSALSKQEEAKIKALTDQVNAAQARIDELEAAQAKKEAQTTLARARAKKSRSVDDIRKSRAAALDVLKTKTVRAETEALAASGEIRVNSGLRLLTEEQAKAIVEIAKSYAEEGIVKLSEVTEKILGHVKEAGIDLTEGDIHRILSGDFPRDEKPKPTRSQGAAQLKAWRDEIAAKKREAAKAKAKAEQVDRQWKAREAAADRRAAMQAQRAKTDAERRAAAEERQKARKEASQARQEARKEYERVFGETSRLQNSIADLEEQLRTGNFAEPKPRPERDPSLQREYERRDLLRKQIQQAIANAKPQTFGEKARIVTRAGMLGNPVSRLFDLTSNAVTYADRQLSKPLESLVDRVLFPKARASEGAASPGLSLERARAVAKGAGTRWKKELNEQMLIGDPVLLEKLGSGDLRTGNERLNALINRINRFAGTTDIPFKDSVYEGALQELADTQARQELGKGASREAIAARRKQIVQEAKDGTGHYELEVTAQNEAIEALFGGDSWGGQIITDVQNAIKRRVGPGGQLVVDLIAPFPRIIANVGGYTNDYLFGSVKAANKLARGRINGEFSLAQRRVVNRLVSRNLRGLGLMAIGYYAYQNGAIKGQVGGNGSYIDYGDLQQALGPVGTVIMLGATIAAAQKLSADDPAKGDRLIRNTAISLFADQPAVAGPTKLVSTIQNDPGKAAGQIVTRPFGLMRAWARYQDQFVTGHERRKTKGFTQTVSSAVPGLRQTLEPGD